MEELKRILKEAGLTGKDMAGMMRMKYTSYRSVTRKSARFIPKWVRGFILGYELGKMSNKD